MGLDQDRFRTLARRVVPDCAPDDAYTRLITAYGEADRAYHNAGHITHCLRELDKVRDEGSWYRDR